MKLFDLPEAFEYDLTKNIYYEENKVDEEELKRE